MVVGIHLNIVSSIMDSIGQEETTVTIESNKLALRENFRLQIWTETMILECLGMISAWEFKEGVWSILKDILHSIGTLLWKI